MTPRQRISQAMRAIGFEPVTVQTSPVLRVTVWCARFLTAPFVDGQEGLSLTRFLAIYFAYLAGVSVQKSNGAISGNALLLCLISASIAFGKSTFTFLLHRWGVKAAVADITQRSTVIVREERDPQLGADPSP